MTGDKKNKLMNELGFREMGVSLKSDKKIILRNRCQCNHCGTVIESRHVHDFVQCTCGRIFTDGGRDYIRRGFYDPSDIIDLTEYEN